MRYLARVGEKEFQIEVAPRGGGRFSVSLDGKTREIERRGDGAVLWLSIDGQVREATVVRGGAPRPAETPGRSRSAGPGGAGRGACHHAGEVYGAAGQGGPGGPFRP